MPSLEDQSKVVESKVNDLLNDIFVSINYDEIQLL